MKLLLDIGNSRLKWARAEQGLQPSGAISHLGKSFANALDAIEVKAPPAEIRAACVAAPEIRQAVEFWAKARFGLPVNWAVSQAEAYGVRNGYTKVEQLGVDRWLAVIAAFHRAKGAALVVDAGTALTLDVVTADGQHLGGLIAPGLMTQRQSLRNQTQLRVTEKESAITWLAQDTDRAIALGTTHGALGLIERVRAGICAEQGSMSFFLTGGEAEQLAPLIGAEWQLVPLLVLEGLALLSPGSLAKSE